jgi:hypothetical protein
MSEPSDKPLVTESTEPGRSLIYLAEISTGNSVPWFVFVFFVVAFIARVLEIVL